MGEEIPDEEVYVVIEGKDDVSFSDLVKKDQIITVTEGLEKEISITVYTADAASGDMGTVWQKISKISTQCNGRVDQDLTLLDEYGAFQLTGFANPDQGTQNIYEQLTFTYSVTNEGALDATLTSAVKTQPGLVELLPNGEPQVLSGSESVSYADEPITINLAEGGEFRYDFFVAGQATQSGGECFDNESYIISIP